MTVKYLQKSFSNCRTRPLAPYSNITYSFYFLFSKIIKALVEILVAVAVYWSTGLPPPATAWFRAELCQAVFMMVCVAANLVQLSSWWLGGGGEGRGGAGHPASSLPARSIPTNRDIAMALEAYFKALGPGVESPWVNLSHTVSFL